MMVITVDELLIAVGSVRSAVLESRSEELAEIVAEYREETGAAAVEEWDSVDVRMFQDYEMAR